MAGWLQKRPARGVFQAIGVSADGLVRAEGYNMTLPLWLKVSARKLGRDAQAAIQGYTDPDYDGQVYYGMAETTYSGNTMASVDVDLAWDTESEPSGPNWPVTQGDMDLRVTLNWATLTAETVTYGLEWWWAMLYTFGTQLQTALEGLGWSRTEEASYAAPDDVLLMLDDKLDVQDIKAKLNNGLAVVHSCTELEPDDGFQGSPTGREGRACQATITLLARTQTGLVSDREDVLLMVEYYAEDLKQLLAPSGATHHTLGGFLYFSELTMDQGPRRADDVGIDGAVARVDFTFTGYKLQLEGE